MLTKKQLKIDEYYLTIAHATSSLSECMRAKVGAVLVLIEDGIIMGQGYNGSLPGLPHCNSGKDCLNGKNCIRTTHAEINCLKRAISSGWQSELENATLYCTHKPCYACMKTIAAFGIKRIVYDKNYIDDNASAYIDLINIEIIQHQIASSKS